MWKTAILDKINEALIIEYKVEQERGKSKFSKKNGYVKKRI